MPSICLHNQFGILKFCSITYIFKHKFNLLCEAEGQPCPSPWAHRGGFHHQGSRVQPVAPSTALVGGGQLVGVIIAGGEHAGISEILWSYLPTIHVGKLRPREGKCLAQGHVAGRGKLAPRISSMTDTPSHFALRSPDIKWLLRARQGAGSSMGHRNWGRWEQSVAQGSGTFHSSLMISSDPGRDLCRCQSHK